MYVFLYTLFFHFLEVRVGYIPDPLLSDGHHFHNLVLYSGQRYYCGVICKLPFFFFYLPIFAAVILSTPMCLEL